MLLESLDRNNDEAQISAFLCVRAYACLSQSKTINSDFFLLNSSKFYVKKC